MSHQKLIKEVDVHQYTVGEVTIEKLFDRGKTGYMFETGLGHKHSIDLFALQDWFDQNRDWINSLREEHRKENEPVNNNQESTDGCHQEQ